MSGKETQKYFCAMIIILLVVTWLKKKCIELSLVPETALYYRFDCL